MQRECERNEWLQSHFAKSILCIQPNERNWWKRDENALAGNRILLDRLMGIGYRYMHAVRAFIHTYIVYVFCAHASIKLAKAIVDRFNRFFFFAI